MGQPADDAFNAFNYLAVLVSIILGLGITQLLGGIGRMLNARHRVRWYWPTMAWTGALLLIHVEAWWGMFGLRNHQRWDFGGFLVVLLLPIALYLTSALNLPDASAAEAVDLREHYFAHSRWFFVLAMLVVFASLLRPIALHDARHLDLDVAAHALFIAGMATAAVTRREWYHKTLAAAFLVLITAYSLLLFGQLR